MLSAISVFLLIPVISMGMGYLFSRGGYTPYDARDAIVKLYQE